MVIGKKTWPPGGRLFVDLIFAKWQWSDPGPFEPLVQLYHGFSWVSYQYYWSIYPDTSQSVVMLAPQPRAPKKAIPTIFKVFGMTLEEALPLHIRDGLKRRGSEQVLALLFPNQILCCEYSKKLSHRDNSFELLPYSDQIKKIRIQNTVYLVRHRNLLI